MIEIISDIKIEPMEALDLEKRIIELCEKIPDGITNEQLREIIPAVNNAQTVAALNKLLSQEKLEVFKKGKKLLYKIRNPDSAKKYKGVANEEKLIYQIVENAGSKGIWIRDIRYKSNLSLTQISKILKVFENKKIMKSVTSASATKKKLYMLYDTEPDQTVTGGPWYSEDGFDSEFVEVLNKQCHNYLREVKAIAENKGGDPALQRNSSFRSSKEIWKYISELKISRIDLTLENIETILTTLIYDGKVEKKVAAVAASKDSDKGILKLYRAVDPVISSAGLMRMPCGTCPVFDDCCEGTTISPSTCQYMKEWLEF